ncbi:MAG: hypothetical protein SFW64_05410 [Alphaproteobacteria bacterium]|nr:hypothetical protein [Alphaproteobacteria bacterium]
MMAADGSRDVAAQSSTIEPSGQQQATIKSIQKNARDFGNRFGKALETLGIEDYDLKMGRSSGACIHLMQDIRTINRLSDNGRMDGAFIERRESWHFGDDDSTKTPQRMFPAAERSRSWPTYDNSRTNIRTFAIHRDIESFTRHLKEFLNETKTELLGILQRTYNYSESDSVSLLSSRAPATPERRLGGDLKDKLAAYRFIADHQSDLISHPFITQSRPKIAQINAAPRTPQEGMLRHLRYNNDASHSR